MMYKKDFVIIFMIIIFFSGTSLIYASTNNKTLIVYEKEKTFASNENKVNHLKELLYVFNKEVKAISIDTYKSNQIDNFDFVFVINIRENIVNKSFLDDLSNYKNKIYWIGDKIENFIKYSDKYQISYNCKNDNITKLIYKNESISIEPRDSFSIIDTSEKSNTLATMSDGYNVYPLIINENNLYYISMWESEKSYIFEDSLNDFYEIDKFRESKVFIKIDEVNPLVDLEKLKEIGDYLYSQNIPFMIGLTPTYIDKSNTIKTLQSNSEFIDTIQYMQNKGGCIILKGYSNYKESEDTLNKAYEFWDLKNDKPIDKDITKYIKDRAISALRICIENNIYPLAFEAPNYAINIDGYKEIKKYFSTYIGRYQNNDDNYFINTFPYIIQKSNSFNILIPENLGTLSNKDDFCIDKIKENFTKLNMVRGYSGGVLIPADVSLDNLKIITQYFKDKKVEFMDLKSENNYVKIDDISITSENEEIRCNYDKSKAIFYQNEKTKFEKTINNINSIVITFVSIILILFLIIFIVFRKINTNKFKRR